MFRVLAGIGWIVVGCSGGNFYDGPAGTLSETEALARKDTIAGELVVSFTQPAGMPSVTGIGAREDVFAGCTTTTPETATDADGDAIAANLTKTFSCSGVAGARATTYNLSGTASEADKDDANALAGYRYEFDMEGSHTSSRSGLESYTYSGFFDLALNGTAYAYTSNYQSIGEYTDDTLGATATWISGSTWNHTLTPDTDPATGTITLGGYWGYGVEISGNFPSATATDFVLAVASEGLKYKKASCTSFYNAGTVTLTDGDGNILKYTYKADCTSPTVTYNDKAI